MRAVRSEKCVVLRGRAWDGNAVIAAFFCPCAPYALTPHISVFSPYFKEFDRFVKLATSSLLFVTLGEQRVENVRREMQDLSTALADYYRFTTFEQAVGDFLGTIWKSRSVSDTKCYPLVREESAVSG
jgi:hypothetical protein